MPRRPLSCSGWRTVVPPERVQAVAGALMGDGLWLGWGVRTLSANETGYNPLVYHNGTVWPHDNSLAAAGLARVGKLHESLRILSRMIEAARHFDYRLPEVFAGFTREPGVPPVIYPTASSPQAWAAATPVLLLKTLLGLEPDREARALRSDVHGLPEWAEALVLSNIHAFGRPWTARVEKGSVLRGPS
jgi:glycogen debranching enzyme